MASYRVYCIDGSGSITSAHWLEAGDDDEAIALAEDANFGMKCEVWDGDRLVGKVFGSPGPAPEPA